MTDKTKKFFIAVQLPSESGRYDTAELALDAAKKEAKEGTYYVRDYVVAEVTQIVERVKDIAVNKLS